MLSFISGGSCIMKVKNGISKIPTAAILPVPGSQSNDFSYSPPLFSVVFYAMDNSTLPGSRKTAFLLLF